MNKVSYALGLGIGRQLADLGGKELNIDDLAQAIKDVISGAELKINEQEAQGEVRRFIEENERKKRASMAEKYKENKANGEAYLEQNAGKDGVVTLPSGLQYQIIKPGSGRKPTATDQVRCHYEGMLIDGTLFDSSVQRGEPAVFGLNQVIKGWTEGVQLMQEGAKYRFFIPYHLGYGEQGAGAQIPPYSALIFDVELIEVLG